MRPYVDFYKANNISPVAQNVSSLEEHFARRRHLARLLGVVPALIEGGTVLEFGPGTGHNALWTLAQSPARYDLIDGNPVGLKQAREMLVPRCPATTKLTIREAFFEDVQPEPIYDLVLAEGFLSLQKDPYALLRHIGQFVKPGGVVVTATMDSVSMLPEMLRRFYGLVAVPAAMPIEEQATAIAALWGPHLSTLVSMTRSHVDWVWDNILHPFDGKLFTVADVIQTLSSDFDVLGGSPLFFSEWRWYKDLKVEDCGANEAAVNSYLENLHKFIDYRQLSEQKPSRESNSRLLDVATQIYAGIQKITSASTAEDAMPVVEDIRRIRDMIAEASPLTAAALDNFIAVVDRYGFVLDHPEAFTDFKGWFGRGQQYVSVTRRP